MTIRTQVTILVGLIGVALTLLTMSGGALASWPARANGVNIAATAQALQAQRRQVELQATLQAESNLDQVEMAQRQQALAELSRDAQAQFAPLERELLGLQSQIDRLTADNKRSQAAIVQLEESLQLIVDDHSTALANLDTDLERLEAEIAAVQTQLQAGYRALEARGQPGPAPPLAEPAGNNNDHSSAQTSNHRGQDSDHTDEDNADAQKEEDKDKENIENKEDEKKEDKEEKRDHD